MNDHEMLEHLRIAKSILIKMVRLNLQRRAGWNEEYTQLNAEVERILLPVVGRLSVEDAEFPVDKMELLTLSMQVDRLISMDHTSAYIHTFLYKCVQDQVPSTFN